MRDMPHLPPRAQRVAARSALLSFSIRRQHAGAGSDLGNLMNASRSTPVWQKTVGDVLRAAGIQFAVAGAVAANNYMPPRNTADFDLALRLADLDRAGEAVRRAGWSKLRDLALYGGLRGTAWEHPDGHELDLLGLPDKLGREAIASAQSNRRGGLPTLTLAHVVVLKLIAARMSDTADIGRMLGRASDAEIEAVRATVLRHRAEDAEELEQMIVLGRLEYQQPAEKQPDRSEPGRPPAPTSAKRRGTPRCASCGRELSDPKAIARGMGEECFRNSRRGKDKQR